MNFSKVTCTEQSKDLIKNIKNYFFIIKLFDNVPRNKRLDIIRYNKNIKEMIKTSINDYKEYSEKYSSIEIEIIPVKNMYGMFINYNKEDEKYYHIYFNNNTEEINRNYLNENEQVEKIKVIIDHQVESFHYLFHYCKCVESINFTKFCRNNINNMGGMFNECSSLKAVNLSNFKTNNVILMDYMFRGCSLLKELNFSSFNTENVINMGFMFWRCSSLKELNLSNFNTNNVNFMHGMFNRCLSLEKLNISNFNTAQVTDIGFMFNECSSLKVLNVPPKFDNNSLRDASSICSGCSDEIEKIIIDAFNKVD